jgi:hypothetical protein
MTRASQTSRGLSAPGPFRASQPLLARSLGTVACLALAASAALLEPDRAQAQQDTTRNRGEWRDTLDRAPRDTFRVERTDRRRNAARPPDFLFAEPHFAFTLRGGMTFPRAGSDVFASAMQDLTLGKGDFRAITGAMDLSFRVAPRLDAVLSGSYGRSSKRSEFRAYLDNNNLPIEQRTRLSQVPLTAGLKAYLLPRGHQIGHFVWIPARVAPYVGAAGGFVWHRFEQSGDFVDHRDLAIYSATSVADGWSPTAHVFGGVDIGITRHAALKVEARYAFASADPGPDFANFNSLDLNGLQTTVGLSWRY